VCSSDLWLKNCFSKFPLYQMLAGGLRYYRATEERTYNPADFLHYGRNVRIEAGVTIAAPERLYLGDNVGLSQRCSIHAVGGCHIGRGCQIGQETCILTIEHQYNGGQALPYDLVRLVKPVYLEDYVWTGTRVCIAPGVRIGEGAIVGMGSVVVQDVPPLAIVAGNPAQVLTYRSRADFDRLKAAGADVDPFKELPVLKVPPITRRKYKNELKDLGFDLSGGSEYFQYDKYGKPGERLMPARQPDERR